VILYDAISQCFTSVEWDLNMALNEIMNRERYEYEIKLS
jgi:hypothetical protein